MKDNYCEKEKKCVLDSNCYIQEGEICDILQKLDLPNCYVKNKEDLKILRESLIQFASQKQKRMDSIRSVYFKRTIYNFFKVTSPVIIFVGLLVGVDNVKMPEEERLYNIEAFYDSNGNKKERLTKDDVPIGEGLLTIYDVFGEYGDLYIRDYAIYDVKGLSLEEAKKIVSDESNFLLEEQFGEPIEVGVQSMEQIIESEKDGYKKIELYAESDDKYYTWSIDKEPIIEVVAFCGGLLTFFIVVAEAVEVYGDYQLLGNNLSEIYRQEKNEQKLAERAIEKTKKLV